MAKVFVVQEPVYFNKQTKQMERKMELTPASAYGNIEFLLDSNRLPLDTTSIVWRMKKKLKDFSDEDFIVPVGNPTAMGIAIAVAALSNRGRVRVLVWTKETGQYIAVSVNLYGTPD